MTHPVAIGAPRDLAAPAAPGTPAAPLVLQTADTQFVEATFEALRSAEGRAGLRAQTAAARDRDHVLKLYQPVQRQFHLALVEAWCETAGTPRLDPARVDSAGIVVRRVRGDAAGGYHEGWMKRAGRVLGWARIDRPAADPLPQRRLPHLPLAAGRAVSPAAGRALAAQALGRDDALLEESTTPLFVAPPEVCRDAGRTVFLGVVPTASSELAARPAPDDEVFGASFGADSKAFGDHLAGALRGDADAFPLAGETVLPQWYDAVEAPTLAPGESLAVQPPGLPDAHHAALRDPKGAGALGMRRFILLLRQLSTEFDAFGDGAAARALQAELAAIRLPLVRRPTGLASSLPGRGAGTPLFEPERSVDAASFLRQAAAVLIEREPDAPRPEMIAAWPALGAEPAARLRRALSAALRARFAAVDGAPGRYDEPGARYVLRAFVRLKPDAAGCARTVWSASSEPFRIAPWYDGAGAPPVRIALPDPTRDFLKSLKPNVAFAVPPSLQALLSGNPKDLAEGKGRPAAAPASAGSAASACRRSRSAPSSCSASSCRCSTWSSAGWRSSRSACPSRSGTKGSEARHDRPLRLPAAPARRLAAARAARRGRRARLARPGDAACATRCAPSSPPGPASSSCAPTSAPASTCCCTSPTPGDAPPRARPGAGVDRALGEAHRARPRRGVGGRRRADAGARRDRLPPGAHRRRRVDGAVDAARRLRARAPRPPQRTARRTAMAIRPPASTTAASTTWSRTWSPASRRTRRNGPTRAWAIPAAR